MSDHQASEAVLVARLRAREHRAMEEVYDRYKSGVCATIFRIVNDRELAEDLVQETFLKCWTRIQLYDAGLGPFWSWILGIARNQAIDYVRSAQGQARNRTTTDAGLDRLPFLDSSSGVGFSSLGISLDGLDEHHRAVLQLSYFYGMSQAEIASQIGRPLGTVKTWMRTAIQIVRLATRPANSSRSTAASWSKPIAL